MPESVENGSNLTTTNRLSNYRPSLLMKWKEWISFIAVTLCQATRLVTKCNWENIKQTKTVLCKWACKQKGSFVSVSTNHENRKVSTKSGWIGAHTCNTLVNSCEGEQRSGCGILVLSDSRSTFRCLSSFCPLLFSHPQMGDALFGIFVLFSAPYFPFSCLCKLLCLC